MGCINSSFEGYCKLSSKHSPCMGCDTDAYDPDRDEYECAVEVYFVVPARTRLFQRELTNLPARRVRLN